MNYQPRSNLITVFTILAVTAMLPWVASSVAKEPPLVLAQQAVETTPGLSPEAELAGRFMGEGYLVTGPARLAKYTSTAIYLVSGTRRAHAIPLTSGRLAVMDGSGKVLTASALQPNTLVYVCQKGQNVAVIVLPAEEDKKDA